jgi:hypothetical protein
LNPWSRCARVDALGGSGINIQTATGGKKAMEGDHQWKTIGKPYLVGGLEHVFFPMSYMGWHPSH